MTSKTTENEPYPSLGLLRTSGALPSRQLETFPRPNRLTDVTLECTEVTSICPITGQPDFATLLISYVPKACCLESKSLKLYIWTLRDAGLFAEALATQVLEDCVRVLAPEQCTVILKQQPRGGISITATASYPKKDS
jgi:7-cyano-7-deazaguanine reductase